MKPWSWSEPNPGSTSDVDPDAPVSSYSNLEEITNWIAVPEGLLVYSEATGEVMYVLPWWLRAWGDERGLFTSSYPYLYPYYPIPNMDPQWFDAWSVQPYQSYYWYL